MLDTRIFVVKALEGWAVLHGCKVTGPLDKEAALAAARLIARRAVAHHSAAEVLLQDGHGFVGICQVRRHDQSVD